jgi:hypothetical protein
MTPTDGKTCGPLVIETPGPFSLFDAEKLTPPWELVVTVPDWPVCSSTNTAPSHLREVQHVGTDAVLAHNLEIWQSLQQVAIDPFQTDDRLVSAGEELDEDLSVELQAVVVECDVLVAIGQLLPKHRVPGKTP